jgi:sugar lactone lactonase YvrE
MSTDDPGCLVGSLLYRTPKGRMTLGEGPVYRASDSTLHWFDCLSSPCELYILPTDPITGLATSEARVVPLADSITVAAFRKDKPGYIGAYYQGVCFLEESGEFKVVCEIIPTVERGIRRFNDGGVDAAGRFWLAEIDVKAMQYAPGQVPGEYGTPVGRLWRYDPDGRLHLMISEGILCGNGVSWSPDNRTSESEDKMLRRKVMVGIDADERVQCTSMTR